MAAGVAGNVTRAVRFAIRRRPDIIPQQENCRSFLDIYDLVGRSFFRAGQPSKRPEGGIWMSAEVSTPQAEKRSARVQVVNSNRRQMLLFAALTLILPVATVWGGRIWLRNSETLVFAVGDANSPEAQFAARLATV